MRRIIPIDIMLCLKSSLNILSYNFAMQILPIVITQFITKMSYVFQFKVKII